jgi:6-phosphofructokinase 1
MNKNVIVGQSGGPTAVINASLYGVVLEALNHPIDFPSVYGMIHGIEGFLQNQYMDMRPLLASGELERIKHTPGSYLGSCRFKLPEDLSDPVYEQLFDAFERLSIGYFFYIGGNDSMDTVSKLSRCAKENGSEIRFIGIPKTIDNDLIGTDHTPGFGSAAKYIATTVREVATDASVYGTKKSVTIVEIMGRHAGWLTAASALARTQGQQNPLLIYLPEVDFDEEAFVLKVGHCLKSVPNLVVCISEGIRDKRGTFICEKNAQVGTDAFGHKMLAGSGAYLERLIKERLGVKVRSVELNVCQRCSSTLVSKTDQDEAALSGMHGVHAALAGETGRMVICKRVSDAPYRVTFDTADVNVICNQEKCIPREWINEEGTDVTEEFVRYALPLIQGEVQAPMKDGVPNFAYRM